MTRLRELWTLPTFFSTPIYKSLSGKKEKGGEPKFKEKSSTLSSQQHAYHTK